MDEIVRSTPLSRRAISLGVSALIVVALIIAAGFGLYFVSISVNPGGTDITTATKSTSSATAYYNTNSQAVRVQNVSLSDYNAPAIHGTAQSNGSVFTVPPTPEGNLDFQVLMPEAMASSSSTLQISVYLNSVGITGCDGLVTAQPVQNMIVEIEGCSAPVTPINSSNNVTIVVSSPLISTGGVYEYQSAVVTAEAP